MRLTRRLGLYRPFEPALARVGAGVELLTWVGYRGQRAAIGLNEATQAAAASTATETFDVFETWLSYWNKTK